MDIYEGDCVMVNLAPFIGSCAPSKQWIPCTVRDMDEDRVLVETEPPHRPVALWVAASWILAGDDREASEEALSSAVS